MTRSLSSRGGTALEEHKAPKGTLLFIIIFLVMVVAFWLNTYLRLWLRH